MPLIAKEVVIKVTIRDSAGKGEGNTGEKTNEQANTKDIIAACVEQVVEILKEKAEP